MAEPEAPETPETPDALSEDSAESAALLAPRLEEAFWRSRQRFRYREHGAFSKKRGHFEPDALSSRARAWAAELTLEENRQEIAQIYENCVTVLKNRRSRMERGDTELDCAQFRFSVQATQDASDPAYVVVTRSLWIKAPLSELPLHFDEIFPFAPDEIVVPFESRADKREMLEILEGWEIALGGRLRESLDQNVLELHLPSGFVMSVDLAEREVSFAKTTVEGALSLAGAVAQDLRALGIRKRVE